MIQLILHHYKDMNSIFLLATRKSIKYDMFKDISAANMPTSCALTMYCTRQPGKVWLDDVQLILHKKKSLDLTLNSNEVSASQLDFQFRADEGKKVENIPAGEYTLSGRVEGDKSDSVQVKFNRIEDAFAE